jgi:type II secretory pathway pseudopilin PulG
MSCFQYRTSRNRHSGLTLVEMLIAMTLMGFVLLSMGNFLFGTNLRSVSVNDRYKLASEVHSLIDDLREDLHRGAYISPNSFRNRLEYTTYDPSTGDAVKKVYGICYYSSVQTGSTDTTCPLQQSGGTFPYLKRSDDGGATWGSPYRISGFNKYRLDNASTPRFLFAHPSNNCIDYVDNNANGVLGSGDTTQTQVSCGTGGNSWFGVTTASLNPTYSSKVVLNNFNFTTGTGRPVTERDLPTYIFIAVAPGPVRSNLAAVAPGVKDTQLMQSFSFDNAVNNMWPAGFNTVDLAWDAAHDRLIIGSDSHSILYTTERNGVFINQPYALNDGKYQARGVAIEDDGNTLHAISNTTSERYHRYNLNNVTPLMETAGGASATFATAQSNRLFMAFASNNRRIYITRVDNDGLFKIVELNGSDPATPQTETGNKWQLPTAISTASQIGGFEIEPTTGDFLIIRNQVYASGGNNYIDLYRIPRTGGYSLAMTPYLSINLTDLGSTATGVLGRFGMTYDASLNRLFLADNVSKRIFEVAPVKVITPQN